MEQEKTLNWQQIKKIIAGIEKGDPFSSIHSYKEGLTISQVIKYFQKQEIDTFTKTMIQNYVRINVLPPPKDKRYYSK